MSYSDANKKYSALGIDTDAAILTLKEVPVSLHCWAGGGFKKVNPKYEADVLSRRN